MRRVRESIQRAVQTVLSERTLRLLWFDLVRLGTRIRSLGRHGLTPQHAKLHVGCGSRMIRGWLNVDVKGSDHDIDLAGGRLPWKDDVFEAAVSQHVIEHLELKSELLPLLRELQRVLKPSGEIWLSCPDIEKVCHSYIEHRGQDLLDDRIDRCRRLQDSDWTLDRESGLENTPSTHMINSLFYQKHEHRNLFDLDLLRWTLELAGFCDVRRVSEAELLARFPEFPQRDDDLQSLYVCARPTKAEQPQA